jgi:heme/copper-type cytochrome/quinol oxidase subunit 3
MTKYIISIASGIILILFIGYLGVFFTFDSGIPDVYPPDIAKQHVDVHAITASAFQENAGLLVTVALALGALYSFGVSRNFDVDNFEFYITLALTVIFGICLTFVIVYAYEVYRAIAIQTDRNLFFSQNIESILTTETRWTFACATLTIVTFCWRCTKVVYPR